MDYNSESAGKFQRERPLRGAFEEIVDDPYLFLLRDLIGALCINQPNIQDPPFLPAQSDTKRNFRAGQSDIGFLSQSSIRNSQPDRVEEVQYANQFFFVFCVVYDLERPNHVEPYCSDNQKICHPERSEEPMHSLAALEMHR